MNTQSILVTYATRYGSTQEVAETIAATLRTAGLEVDLRPMQDVKTLDGYAAIVLGAALYNTRWHADAHRFLAQQQAALLQRPVAIFALGPLSTSAAAMRNSRRQLDRELARYLWLKPMALEVFAGKFDPSRPGLNFFERRMSARDHRDWEAIRAWAGALPAQLQITGVLNPA